MLITVTVRMLVDPEAAEMYKFVLKYANKI